MILTDEWDERSGVFFITSLLSFFGFWKGGSEEGDLLYWL